MTRNKLHVLDENRTYAISNKINTQDYVTMHKAELESIIMNADLLNWIAEFSDKIGAGFLGVWLTLLGTSTCTRTELWMSFVFGVFLTTSGIYYKCKRNQKINSILKDKLKEIDNSTK